MYVNAHHYSRQLSPASRSAKHRASFGSGCRPAQLAANAGRGRRSIADDWWLSRPATPTTSRSSGPRPRGRNQRRGRSRTRCSSACAYAVSKGALARVTLTLADKLADRRITLNRIARDGSTPAGARPELFAAVADRLSAGSSGEPDDPARLIACRVSDDGPGPPGPALTSEGGVRRWDRLAGGGGDPGARVMTPPDRAGSSRSSHLSSPRCRENSEAGQPSLAREAWWRRCSRSYEHYAVCSARETSRRRARSTPRRGRPSLEPRTRASEGEVPYERRNALANWAGSR
jgi:hypothetical protein